MPQSKERKKEYMGEFMRKKRNSEKPVHNETPAEFSCPQCENMSPYNEKDFRFHLREKHRMAEVEIVELVMKQKAQTEPKPQVARASFGMCDSDCCI